MGRSALSDLLDQATNAGVLDSQGEFHLDLEAAIRKLREHQVSERFHYVNRLLRAALMVGAKRAEVRSDSSRTLIGLSAPIVSPLKLETLFQENLVGRSAAGELAASINQALGLQPKRFELRLDNGEIARILVSQDSEKVKVYEADSQKPGTFLQLNQSWKTSTQTWGPQSPEYLSIYRRFRFTPLRIFVNEHPFQSELFWGDEARPKWWDRGGSRYLSKSFFSLSRSFRPKHHVAELRVFDPNSTPCLELGPSRASSLCEVGGPGELKLAVGLRVDQEPSVARFVYQGEMIQSFPAKVKIRGADILISANHLKLDLSGEKLVQDESFQETWEEAKSWIEKMRAQFASQYKFGDLKDLHGQIAFDLGQKWAKGMNSPP